MKCMLMLIIACVGLVSCKNATNPQRINQIGSPKFSINLSLSDENDCNVDNNFFNNNAMLAFIFEPIDCNTCIETIIKHLSLNHPELKNKLIVISDYQNPRDLIIFKRVNNFEGTVYRDINHAIIDRFKGKTPSLCILKNDSISNIIHEGITDKVLLEKYLESINPVLN